MLEQFLELIFDNAMKGLFGPSVPAFFAMWLISQGKGCNVSLISILGYLLFPIWMSGVTVVVFCVHSMLERKEKLSSHSLDFFDKAGKVVGFLQEWVGWSWVTLTQAPAISWVNATLMDKDPTNNMISGKWYDGMDKDDMDAFIASYKAATDRDVTLFRASIMIAVAVVCGREIGMAFAMIMLMWKYTTQEQKQFLVTIGNDQKFDDGVYHVVRHFFGFPVSNGIGIVWKGVFHTRKHVVGNSEHLLTEDGRLLKCFYRNDEKDLITWGGLPKIENPGHGDECTVKIYNPQGVTFCVKTKYNGYSDTVGILKSAVTVEGCSGSPIFLHRDDGTLSLAGLAGRNLWTPPNGKRLWETEVMQVEILPKIEVEVSGDFTNMTSLTEGGNRQIFQAPGTGKTVTIIPALLKEGLEMDKMVIVSPPTWVISKATVHDLRAKNYRVADYSEGGIRDQNPEAHVMPHAVLVGKIIKGTLPLSKPLLIIIDESHSNSPQAQLLLHHARHICGRINNRDSRHQLVELTATGYDLVSGEYVVKPISPERVDNLEFEPTLEGFQSTLLKVADQYPGKKVVVFCPKVSGPPQDYSVASVTWYLKNSGRNVQVIPFFRNNRFRMRDQAIASGIHGVTTFIVTTNMSEVGINLQADVCIDPMLQVDFIAQPGTGIFRKMTKRETRAQQVQRQGRVGRWDKFGVYYSPAQKEPEGVLYHDGCISLAESTMAADALGYPIRVGEPMRVDIGLKATVQQVRRWIEGTNVYKGKVLNGLIATILYYDDMGMQRDIESIRMIARVWSNHVHAKLVLFRGVRFKTAFFDERDGDAIFNALACLPFTGQLEERKAKKETEEPVAVLRKENECVAWAGQDVVGEDHRAWTCRPGHSHLCSLCGHVFSHEHPIEVGFEHEMVCPCH